jgi:ArsR family transcriptional regulator
LTGDERDGDELLALLAALAHPIRIRIVAAVAGRSTYVSQLARDLGISRPLLHMHLQKLEAAGVVVGRMEVSEDGKAMRYVEVTDFAQHLDAATLARAASSLRNTSKGSTT